MKLKKDLIRKSIERVVDKWPEEILVVRPVKNELNETVRGETVTTLKGQYYTGAGYRGSASYIRLAVEESGKVPHVRAEKFITAETEKAKYVKLYDMFTLNGVTYEIVDLGRNYGIYYDFSLERVSR